MYLRLPGGFSEEERAAALRQHAAAVSAQAEALSSAVVERPMPSQYGAVVKDVGAFVASTGSTSRIVSLADGLEVQCFVSL